MRTGRLAGGAGGACGSVGRRLIHTESANHESYKSETTSKILDFSRRLTGPQALGAGAFFSATHPTALYNRQRAQVRKNSR
ncbi:hypothetical protein [Pandoravirus japonicus]|uniref:Uncharacterized protein n=1 Tax=Pandoravirus japonicus TaxID=2823154 RepID=A0A811BRF8_9VIRU|nr:hypothetical protein [Pandoravirus japonicus]